MAVHVVGFTDIIRYDGNTPVFKGRQLLEEYYNTSNFKKLKPGEIEVPYPHTPERRWEFVAATPFNADLEISNDFTFGGPYVSLYMRSTNTYYPMFHSDFITMAENTVIDHGRFSGMFDYVKKNKNFGIRHIGEFELE